MEYLILEAKYNGKLFRIEEDLPDIGAYLYVYEMGVCIQDYLQDDIATCKQIALEDYNVPLEIWEELEE